MRRGWPLLLALFLSACFTGKGDAPTLKSLSGQRVKVDTETPIEKSEEKAIAAYREYLNIAPRHSLRPEALRRLGDMELEQIERGETPGGAVGAQDYQRAIKVYQDLLKTYPTYAGNDRVLYQLARAQDQTGDLKRSLATLDRLVREFPRSAYRDEAEFRRGELLFTLNNYAEAEKAYAVVMRRGQFSPYYERSLYMHGWSLFKQGQFDQALHSFLAVLDRKLIGRDSGLALDEVQGLSRADRELVEDTFRVASVSLTALDGAESIPLYFKGGPRSQYEFRMYQNLGDLYIKQQRVKDAADTFNAFARRYPTHPQAPIVQVKVIEAYTQAGFATLALASKEEFATRYGVKSEYRRVNSETAYARVLPHVRTHTEELARHYHASAQKTRAGADYEAGAKWYQTFIDSFPQDPKAAAMNYLYADLLFESRRYAAAAEQYERTAYEYPRHAKSADAGYAALTALDLQRRCTQQPDPRAVQLRAVDSALRFAERFPEDPRSARVLTNAAEMLYAANLPERANGVARRVLALKPPASTDQQRTAWTVVAHTEFERGQYDRAEAAYQQALLLLPAGAATRPALTERLAASVYKQGERARGYGSHREAANNFLRVGQVAPSASIRATAQYDAAASLIALKDWNAAGAVLEDFRRSYPTHALQAEVPGKLAVVYLESGQTFKAAAEFESIAATKKDIGVSREALWQAAELYEKAGREKNAQQAYERYVRQFPSPLEPAVEARYRLATMSVKHGQPAQQLKLCQEIIQADQKGGRERTDRTRYLGANCTLALAEPADQAYKQVKLVEPLKKNLKLKKERLETALANYTRAVDYGVADVATAATFRTAELYQDFSRALLGSQRPKGLSKDEIEQYNVLLEEQAFPFEEKAIEIHEINARRAKSGVYDQWVKKSYASLGQLRPVRYAKREKREGYIESIR
jgi:TolA-binding protein